MPHEENSKTVKKFKNKLKNKIIAWTLVGTIFVGIAICVGLFIYDKTRGDSAYNDAIRTRYEQVDEKLTIRLSVDTEYKFLENKEITHIRFLEPKKEILELQVFYIGEYRNSFSTFDGAGYAVYNVLIDYYNALVDAEPSDNVLHYLDALNTIFTEMQLIDSYYNERISCDLFEYTEKNEENIIKVNEIFALNGVENEDIIRQIGFLPYNLKIVDYHYNFDTHRHDYTYKISGISYCETKSENSDEIKEHKDLILESGYNKNHIKTYNRDILFTSSLVNEVGMDSKYRVGGDLYMIINGINSPYTIETTLFKEVDLLKIYEDVKDGDFNYKKPKEFDVKQYIKNNLKNSSDYFFINIFL